MAGTTLATAEAGAGASGANGNGDEQPLSPSSSMSSFEQEQEEQREQGAGPIADANGAQQPGSANGGGASSNGNGTLGGPRLRTGSPNKKVTFQKRQALGRAVAQGQIGRVRALIETDLARDVKDKGAYNALIRYYAGVAVRSRHEPVLDFLLSKLPADARLNRVLDKEVKRVSHLVDEQPPDVLEAKDMGLRSLFCPAAMAICAKDEPLALRLLARPNDPVELVRKSESGNGSTGLCLHAACRFGLVGVVEALVAGPHHVPVLENVNSAGETPLCVALEANQAAVVRFLCRRLRGFPQGATPQGLIDVVDHPSGVVGVTRVREEVAWAAGYRCLRADGLDALQALLEEVPGYAEGFLGQQQPRCPIMKIPAVYAADNLSLRCIRWLVEEHGGLETPGLLHQVVAAPASKEEECLPVLEYLVEECGVGVDALAQGKTAAEVALISKRQQLHDYLTRGKRQAAAEEAAQALLAELMAEEERKAQRQQKKKMKGKKAAGKGDGTDAAEGGPPLQQPPQQAAAAAAGAAAGQAAVQAASVSSRGKDKKEAGKAKQRPEASPAAREDDRKMPAPPIPDSEGEDDEPEQELPQPPAAPAAAAPAAAGPTQRKQPPPSKARAAAAAAAAASTAARVESKSDVHVAQQPPPKKEKGDPREAAFLLHHAREQDKCPLARRLLVDPVIASDGYTYERAALEAYAAKAKAGGERLVSPVTGEMIADVFFPNVAVKKLIEQYVQAKRAEWRRLQQHAGR